MSRLPTGITPMLATSGSLPDDEAGWAFEVKWDGVRALAAVADGKLTLTTRRGNDVTSHYPEVAELAGRLAAHPCLLDGELVTFESAGRTDFGRLQSRIHVGRPSDALRVETPVTYVVFDVLHLDGAAVLTDPYDVRRELLATLGLDGPSCQAPAPFLADGRALGEATRVQGLEGVVAKRRDSPYEPGRRSPNWRKVKHVRRQSAVVVGWQPGEGGRSGRLGSLLLAVPGPDGLVFVGHVGTGFTDPVLESLARRLARLGPAPCPLATPAPSAQARTAVWVRPELVADVDFTEWTRDGRLRHPSFKGLRDDLSPVDVEREP